MKLQRILLKSLVLCACLLGKITAMEPKTVILKQDKPVQLELASQESDWYKAAKIGQKPAYVMPIKNPLKVQIVNKSGDLVLSDQQGQGNFWWTAIPAGNSFEDNTFNMSKISDLPQYLLRTHNNVYILNFEEKPLHAKTDVKSFTAQLYQLNTNHGITFASPHEEALQSALLLEKHPIATPQNVLPGNVVTITVDKNNAKMAVTKE